MDDQVWHKTMVTMQLTNQFTQLPSDLHATIPISFLYKPCRNIAVNYKALFPTIPISQTTITFLNKVGSP